MAKDELNVKDVKERQKPMYDKFKVKLTFRDRVYGGLPLSKKLVEQYVEAKLAPGDKAFADKFAEETSPKSEAAKELELINETERITTGFKSDEDGSFIGDYVIKAHLKQAASLLKITQTKRGSKDTVKEALFIKPVAIHLGKEPDGTEEFCGHVMTPTGKRSILKASQYFDKPTITFEIWVLNVRNDKFNANDLKMCFEFGQELGIGSNRSFEKGKYDLINFVPIDPE